MEVTISKWYLAVLFLLWIGSVGSGIWGWPIWTVISFMSFFAIYAGHEWAHIWVCGINHLDIESLSFDVGGRTHCLFSIDTDNPNKTKIESDVYLAGVAWDAIWFAISILSSIFYGYLLNEFLPITFGCSLVLILIFNLAMPGSDWQEFRKRTTLRA